MNSSLVQYTGDKPEGILGQTEEINIFVADALRYVIQHVFSKISGIFTITISTAATPVELWLQDIMGRLFATWGFMAVEFMLHDSKHNYSYVHVPGRRYCNIILVDSFESLQTTKISEHNRRYDTLEYYFIFLQIRDSWMPRHRAMILKYCFDNYWLHCNVMTQNSRGEVLVYTYFPFQESGCFRTDAVLINQFNGERFVNDVMFPNKLENFHGCPLKLTTWDIPPFVTYPQESSEEELSGLEMTLLRTLGELLNFSLKVDSAMTDPALSSNSTSSRTTLGMSILASQLKYPETNITSGYLRRNPKHDIEATPSAVIYSLPLRLIDVPRHNRFRYMTVLIFPFDRYTWLLLIISLISTILIYSIGKKADRRYNKWFIVETLFGVSTYRSPKHPTLRTIFNIWIISTFFIRSAYQARLFLLYRTSFYDAPPKTIAELVDRGYKIVCTKSSEEFIKYVPVITYNIMPLIVLNTSDELEPLLYLKNHSEEFLVAASTLEIVIYHIPRKLKGFGRFILIDPVLNTQQTSLYFAKHSYLAEKFDESILYFHQAGLINRWREQFVSSSKVTRRSGSVIRSYEGSLMINMRQFSGFLLLVFTFHIGAIVVFALEVASKNIIWLQRCF